MLALYTIAPIVAKEWLNTTFTLWQGVTKFNQIKSSKLRSQLVKIYTFMMHCGPFGCIRTAMYSENTYCQNQVPGLKLRGRFQSPPGAIWRSFCNFPHTPRYPGCVENCKNLIKLHQVGCGSGHILEYFFQNFRFHFSKNCKNYKKIIRVTKKLKNYSLVPIFWYMFCGTNNFFKKLFKKIIF